MVEPEAVTQETDESPRDTLSRSLLKAITWRVIATTTTMALVFIFTGKLLLAGGIGALEALSKMLFYYLHERAWDRVSFGKSLDRPKSRHIEAHRSQVSARERRTVAGTKPLTVWFTGLPGTGKTTLSYALERHLFDNGYRGTVLDGENMRLGLSRDLGFGRQERTENVRRTAEAAKIINDAGLIAICGLISPFADDREHAKEIIGEERFLEVHLDADEATLHGRSDGLYDLAEKGEIRHFTGVSDPYEPPLQPSIRLDTADKNVDECVHEVMTAIRRISASET